MNEDFTYIKADDIKRNLINLSQIVLEVTDLCNLNCKYCAYGDLYKGYDPRSRINLTFIKACNIINYLVTLDWTPNYRTLL
jgi:uncharacterized protein